MSDELTAFLNFVFKKQETVTKVLEDDKVTMADRWQLNWREYERELASLGLPAADAEKRPSLLRYGIPQPSAAVLNDLLGFQAEMREVMGRISREKIVPAEFFKRLVGESKKVLASVFYVANEAEGDITPESIGSVRMSFCYDAATYDRVIAAIILELVANKTIFNLETTPEGFFYFDLPSAQPLPAPSFVPGEDFSAADVPDSPDDGDDDADFDQSPRKAFSQAEQLVQTILGSMDREAQDRSLAALFEILSMVDQKTAVGETGGEDVLTGDEEAREAGEAKAEEIAEAALETESPEASVPLLADRAPKRTEPGGGDSKSADAVPETGGGDEPKPEVPSPDAEFFPDLPPFTLEPEVKKILEDELVPEQIEIGLVDDLQDFVPDLPADPESEPGGTPGGKKAGPADEAEGQASNQANEIRGILAKIESGGPEGGTSDVLLALEEGCQEGDVVVVEGGGDGVGAKDAEETGPVGGDEGPGASANDEGPSVAHDDGLIIADGDDDAGHGDGPDDEYFLSAPMLADAHEETSGVDAEENTGDAEPADDADSPDEVWEPATEDDDGESGMPSPPSAEAAGTSGESLFKWWPEEKAVVPLVPESPFGGAAPGFLASPKNFDDEIIEPVILDCPADSLPPGEFNKPASESSASGPADDDAASSSAADLSSAPPEKESVDNDGGRADFDAAPAFSLDGAGSGVGGEQAPDSASGPYVLAGDVVDKVLLTNLDFDSLDLSLLEIEEGLSDEGDEPAAVPPASPGGPGDGILPMPAPVFEGRPSDEPLVLMDMVGDDEFELLAESEEILVLKAEDSVFFPEKTPGPPLTTASVVLPDPVAAAGPTTDDLPAAGPVVQAGGPDVLPDCPADATLAETSAALTRGYAEASLSSGQSFTEAYAETDVPPAQAFEETVAPLAQAYAETDVPPTQAFEETTASRPQAYDEPAAPLSQAYEAPAAPLAQASEENNVPLSGDLAEETVSSSLDNEESEISPGQVYVETPPLSAPTPFQDNDLQPVEAAAAVGPPTDLVARGFEQDLVSQPQASLAENVALGVQTPAAGPAAVPSMGPPPSYDLFGRFRPAAAPLAADTRSPAGEVSQPAAMGRVREDAKDIQEAARDVQEAARDLGNNNIQDVAPDVPPIIAQDAAQDVAPDVPPIIAQDAAQDVAPDVPPSVFQDAGQYFIPSFPRRAARDIDEQRVPEARRTVVQEPVRDSAPDLALNVDHDASVEAAAAASPPVDSMPTMEETLAVDCMTTTEETRAVDYSPTMEETAAVVFPPVEFPPTVEETARFDSAPIAPIAGDTAAVASPPADFQPAAEDSPIMTDQEDIQARGSADDAVSEPVMAEEAPRPEAFDLPEPQAPGEKQNPPAGKLGSLVEFARTFIEQENAALEAQADQEAETEAETGPVLQASDDGLPTAADDHEGPVLELTEQAGPAGMEDDPVPGETISEASEDSGVSEVLADTGAASPPPPDGANFLVYEDGREELLLEQVATDEDVTAAGGEIFAGEEDVEAASSEGGAEDEERREETAEDEDDGDFGLGQPWPECFRGTENQAVEFSLAVMESRLFVRMQSNSTYRPADLGIDWKGIKSNSRDLV